MKRFAAMPASWVWRAPVNGFITNLNLAKGTYASQGKPVMALIDSEFTSNIAAMYRPSQLVRSLWAMSGSKE